jgi:predicted DNA-binding transcriptional regulator AlpA
MDVDNKVVIFRKADVIRVTGLCMQTIRKLELSGLFPKRFNISPRLVGWKSTDIYQWINERANQGKRGIKAIPKEPLRYRGNNGKFTSS